MKQRIAFIVLVLLAVGGAKAADIGGVPAPTIYSRPTPSPVAPPVNPGPAVTPPAGLSPLLTGPGPDPRGSLPAFPGAQLPGPVGQQKLQSYRNMLFDQQRQLERSGIAPGSERSREIQQQLNQTAPR